MMKIRFEIEYDGGKFCGWQRQINARTVQGTLEDAISRALGGAEVTLYGAGRTDSGVHAIRQVAHMEIFDEHLIAKWKNQISRLNLAINFYLHDTGVVVRSSEIAAEDFHARFSAKQRAYLYAILNRSFASPLLKNRVWLVAKHLDSYKMQEASQLLVGKHNFNAFRSSECQASNPVRTIDSIEVKRKEDFVLITVKAKSFLHNQVRIIAGTLVSVGQGKMTQEQIGALLRSGDRTKSGPTAPAHGLYFQGVLY